MKSPFLILIRLLVLSSLFLLGACNTDDPTTGTTKVAGQVVQRQSRQPVGNGTVQVYLASSGGGYREVGNPQPCDGQGKFSFDFDAESKSSYLLKADAPPGYITGWADAPELIAGRKNTGLVVPVLAPAWVRFVLVDEPPKSRVLIFVTGYSGNGDRTDYPGDTTLIRPALADLPRKLIWVITDERGNKAQHELDVKLAPLDTLDVRIAF